MSHSFLSTALALVFGCGFLAVACAPAPPAKANSELNATEDDEDEDDDDDEPKTTKRAPTVADDEEPTPTGNVDLTDPGTTPPGTTPPPGSGDPEQCIMSCIGSDPAAQQADQRLMQCDQQCGQNDQCWMQCEQQVCGQAPQACDKIFSCVDQCEGGQGGFDPGGFFGF